MPVLTLIQPHTHAGIDYSPGDVDTRKIGMSEAEAEWLIAQDAAKWKKEPKKPKAEEAQDHE